MNGRACGWALVALLMACAVGCGPTAPAASPASPSDDDTLAIKQVVLKDLFDFQENRLHPVRPSISAYVIDDPEAKKLASAFAGHQPPVIVARTTTNAAAEDIDAATGRPVEVYQVRIREVECDRARVGAGWHSAPLVGLWYTYELVRTAGVWTIKDRAVVGVR